METVKLKNSSLPNISIQINSLIQALTESKLFTPKFYITNLSSALAPLFKNFEDTRTELIKKHGKNVGEDKIEVPEFTDETKTENTQEYKDFVKEISEFLELETEVSITKIPLSVFEKVDAEFVNKESAPQINFSFYPDLYQFIKA